MQRMVQISSAITSIGNTHLSRIAPNEILAFDARVSALPDMIKLTLGEPDFDVDEALLQEAVASLKRHESHYVPPSGTGIFRQSVAQFLQQQYGLTYDPDTEIIATVGATEAIFVALMTLLNPGDELLIPTPTFPLYEADARLLGAVPISLDTSQDGFVLTPHRLRMAMQAHPNARVLMLNYPSNPTGVTYTSEQLAALAEVVRDKPMVIVADEIYSELVYDGKHTSIAQLLPGQTILLNGVSKSHAMTGYRIGFIAAPQELARKMMLPHAFAVTCLPAPMMAAAAAALRTQEGRQATKDMREQYLERRNFLVDKLCALGFEVVSPQGAFYVFAKPPQCCGDDDVAFAEHLAQHAHVAVIAGSYFGAGGSGYLRLSYATSMEALTCAVDRIAAYLQDVHGISVKGA